MGKPSRSINLLKKDENTFFDDFINWALGLGRVVIILTEAIALGVFLYRFSLDIQISNTQDLIKQKKIIVDTLKNSEVKYRNLQDRLALAKQMGPQAGILDDRLMTIVNNAPEGAIFQGITISPEEIHVIVLLTSTASLSDFVKSLRSSPIISGVSIDKIENKTSESILAVTLTATLKK